MASDTPQSPASPEPVSPLAETRGWNPVAHAISNPALNSKVHLAALLAAGGTTQPYVISYYLHTDAQVPTSRLYGGFMMVSPENPPTLLNDEMVEATRYAFDTIAAQLPGRFVFKQVYDPAAAMIQVAGIRDCFDYERDNTGQLLTDAKGKFIKQPLSGNTMIKDGTVLLGASSFTSAISASNRKNTVLHEILHAMGLSHPHGHRRTDAGLDMNGTSYLDTVMTYESENDKDTTQPGPRARYQLDLTDAGYPASLMPADLKALADLYPLDSDQQGIRVGPLRSGVAETLVHVTSLGGGQRASAVPFLNQGVIYHPQRDGADNTLVISGNLDAVHPVRPGKLIPLANGTEIIEDMGDARNGAVVIPVRAETIVLATDIPHTVEFVNNTHLIVQPATLDALNNTSGQHVAVIDGTNNQVTLGANQIRDQTFKLFLKPGASVQVNITDAASFAQPDDDVSLRSLIGVRDNGAALVVQREILQDAYAFTIAPKNSPLSPVKVRFVLDTHDGAAHARFLEAFERRLRSEEIPGQHASQQTTLEWPVAPAPIVPTPESKRGR